MVCISSLLYSGEFSLGFQAVKWLRSTQPPAPGCWALHQVTSVSTSDSTAKFSFLTGCGDSLASTCRTASTPAPLYLYQSFKHFRIMVPVPGPSTRPPDNIPTWLPRSTWRIPRLQLDDNLISLSVATIWLRRPWLPQKMAWKAFGNGNPLRDPHHSQFGFKFQPWTVHDCGHRRNVYWNFREDGRGSRSNCPHNSLVNIVRSRNLFSPKSAATRLKTLTIVGMISIGWCDERSARANDVLMTQPCYRWRYRDGLLPGLRCKCDIL